MVLGLVFVFLYLIPDAFYWVKWALTCLCLWARKRNHRGRFDLYDYETENQPEKCGYLVPQEEKILERPFSEEHLEKAADEIFFYGVNSRLECLVLRLSRACGGRAEAWVDLRLADGRRYQLQETGHQRSCEGTATFSCGGLQMHYLSPLRRWRISYCGMMKDGEEETKKSTFVKFTFVWTASSEVYDFPSSLKIKPTAEAMAKAQWRSVLPPIDRLVESFDFYCQSGVLAGTVTVEGMPDAELYLFGERIRNLGNSSSVAGCKFKHILGVVPENGLIVHLAKASIPNAVHNLTYGFIVHPNGNILVIEDGLIISKMSEADASKRLTAMFKAGKTYELIGGFDNDGVHLSSELGWRGNLDMQHIEFTVEGLKGSGLLLSGDITDAPVRSARNIPPVFPRDKPLTVYFTDEVSHLGDLTGGKGSSLGKLTDFSKKVNSFVVPKGIVVTTQAYSEFLTSDVLHRIEELKNVVYGNVQGDPKKASQIVVSAIERSFLPDKIAKDIEKKLDCLFDGKINHHMFAVRSSAMGEDTEQMSAAGQMDTFLGVHGLKEIFTAVKKCWASQFGPIAIEYKRQNGQILNSPMAVVIQEMVHCDAAGVLFTCDPVTSNPSTIVITGNYGLGESVVSGSEEPDTVVLRKLENSEVEIKSVTIGSKSHKIVVHESDAFENETDTQKDPASDVGETSLENVSEDLRAECCISEEMIQRLGRLSVEIEDHFKSPRDIEWGIKDDTIYIFQSRPVTAGLAPTDYGIQHELDGPLRCEGEFFTTANTGEVMPGATSPLGLDIVFKVFPAAMRRTSQLEKSRSNFVRGKYYPIGCLSFYNHMMMSVIELLTQLDDYGESLMSKSMMTSIFGRVLDDPEIKKMTQYKEYPPMKMSFFKILRFVKNLFFCGKTIPQTKERVFKFEIPIRKSKTASEAFDLLVHHCSSFNESCILLFLCSGMSSAWNMYLISLLATEKGSIDTEVYSDFSKLLSTQSNVESAEVPSAMKDLADLLSKEPISTSFKSMPVEEAQKWLEQSDSLAGCAYRRFLQRHGHRCLKEFDVFSRTWAMNPKPLIKLLQAMVGTTSAGQGREILSVSQKISQLKIPLSWKSRLLLRFIVPNCLRGVREREECKSILIKSMDNMRRAYDHLSRQMVSEGYLPDSDLLFFLTNDEIKELLETRNPRLLSRAIHRRKMHPMLDKLLFNEISKGRPIPVNQNEDDPTEYVADLTMTGTPVSQGIVKAYARVAVSLEEAASLQPGEVLITHSTDIAWSPYFPILAGVVTELGGLISHGAVVSREYGIPCIAGLHGATKKFVTGDFVKLDGYKGTLQRIPMPKS